MWVVTVKRFVLFADSLGVVAISSRALSEQPVNQAVLKLYILPNI